MEPLREPATGNRQPRPSDEQPGADEANSKWSRRTWLVVSLVSNLTVLGFFKYFNFFVDSVQAALGTLGIEAPLPLLQIVLPVGISFYTFQTLSYTLDVYLRRAKPADSFLDFALYVGFFPQLVAGPIVRATDFLPQCGAPKAVGGRDLGLGAALLVFGLFEKVVLADWLLSPSADAVFNQAASAGTLDAWAGALAFSGQIFFDFGGYSMCAIGAAICLGFHLPRNFRSPYAAIGFSDFWRRWHISLSTWLRDYLYIPLGGNRDGERAAGINVLITMLIGGLWHGASWRFVVWGGLHGLYLVIERKFRQRAGAGGSGSGLAGRLLGALATFVVVTVTWTFFRAQTMKEALLLIGRMFVPRPGAILDVATVTTIGVVMAATLVVHWLLRDRDLEVELERVPWWAGSLLLACAMLAILAAPGDDRAFIYFQF